MYIYNYSNNKNDRSVSTNLIKAYTQTTSLNCIIITIPGWEIMSMKKFKLKKRLNTRPLAKWEESSPMVLDAALLNTQHNKVRIKVKLEQSRECKSTRPYYYSVLGIKKGTQINKAVYLQQ